MDLPNGRDIPNGAVAVNGSMANPHHRQEEEQGVVSLSTTKLEALENGIESDTTGQNFLHPSHLPEQLQTNIRKDAELAAIRKDLKKIKRQNTITHVLLGTIIVMTAAWQVNEVSFLLWVQSKLSNPFKSLGDMIKASLKIKGKRSAVIESSPLPPVGIPDVMHADLQTFVISGDHR